MRTFSVCTLVLLRDTISSRLTQNDQIAHVEGCLARPLDTGDGVTVLLEPIIRGGPM